jgi:predicted Zn-dependent peptidase
MSVNLTELDNGLRVVSHRMPHLETASVGVWLDAGARHERAEEHGLAHLIEHMAFKGTSRRSAARIAEEIEAVGGDLNAGTSMEHTAYVARVLKADTGLALDIIADILLDSTFEPAELEREKVVIAQEIAAANDAPDDIVFDLVQESAFPDQPVGRPILGTAASVGAFTSEGCRAFLARQLRPGALVVGAAGAVEHEAVVEQAGRLFGHLAPGGAEPAVPARYVGGDLRRERDLEQAHIVLAFEGVSYLAEDAFAAQVLAGALGGGMSSRLFQKVREERGLAYSIYAFAAGYRDTGLFGISSATAPEMLGELVEVTAAEVARAAVDLGEDEVARARAQLKAGLLMSLESTGARLEQITRQVAVFGRVLPVEEILARVEAIDAAAVRALAGRVLSGSKLSVGAIGPLTGLANRARLAESFAP